MKKIVFAFGRLNPPTSGHQKLVNKIKSVASSNKADAALYLSHSHDKKKNPLTYDDKIKYTTKAFGKIVKKTNARTIIEVLKELDKKYDEVIVIAGSDRVEAFDKLVTTYNGKDYAFEKLEVVSAGERDPDADDVSGMSASKLRSLAQTGEFAKFKSGLPRGLQKGTESKKMYDQIRAAAGITEEMTLDEVLSIQQRLKKRQIAKRIKNKLKLGRRRSARRMANKKKLTTRASKKARQMVRDRLAGAQGRNYKNLSPGAKVMVDKKIANKRSLVQRLAKRIYPKVKKAEVSRLKRYHQRKESYEILNVVNAFYDDQQKLISEKVEKNLIKKSEKYGVNLEELKMQYLTLKQFMSENETFDTINTKLAHIAEDDKPNKRGDDSKGHKRPTEDGAGLTRKGAKAAGVKTAVTTPPSKLDPDGKAAKRRKSFCARMGGMKGPMKDEKGRPTRKAMSLRRWNC